MKKLFRMENLYPFLSFFIPFVLYIFTLAPGLTFGDTGELVTAAYTLGIPHPPGSPAWVLLAKLFTFLPVGNIAYRVNLASAAFAALAAVVVFYICKKVLIAFINSLEENTNPVGNLSRKEQKKQKNVVEQLVKTNTHHLDLLKKYINIISCSSAVLLGVLPAIWTFAVVTEVYTLNLLFTALILYCIVSYIAEEEKKYIYWGSFLFGLAITNHYLILFLGLAATAWILFHKRSILSEGKTVVIALLCLFTGLLLFLYLPIRSAANPPIDWGNPETFNNMMAVIFRKQFAGGKVDPSPILPPQPADGGIVTTIFQSIVSTIKGAIYTYSFFTIIVILGIYAALRYIRNYYIPLLYSFLFCSTFLAILIHYQVTAGDRTSTFMSAYIALSVGGAVGIVYSLYLLLSHVSFLSKKTFQFVISLVIILIPTIFIRVNYAPMDMSKNNIAHVHAQKLLEIVPKNAIIFTEENNWLFPLLYMHSVEKLRPDVTIYDRNGNLFQNIYEQAVDTHRSEDDLERKRRAIEVNLISQTGRPAYYAVDKTFENYGYTNLQTEGILYKQGQASPINFETEYPEILGPDITEYSKYSGSEYIIAYYHLQYAETLRRNKQIDEALKQYDLAAKWGKNETIILNNLAVIYSNMGENDRAKNVLLQALQVNDKNLRVNKNLGVLYAQEGNYEQAEKYFLKALSLNDHNIETIIALSMLYEQTDRKEKALEGYQFALSLDPQNVDLQQKVQQLSQ